MKIALKIKQTTLSSRERVEVKNPCDHDAVTLDRLPFHHWASAAFDTRLISSTAGDHRKRSAAVNVKLKVAKLM